MIPRGKIFRAIVALVYLIAVIGSLYLGYQKIMSLSFRQTNNFLHAHGAPVTLDFLIPKGRHIDDKITVKEVLYQRFGQPYTKLNLFFSKASENMPLKVLVAETIVLYLFWTFLFLVFFRIFTWMRYASVWLISFLLGAGLYFFMPDFIHGRIDDGIFLGWAIALIGLRFLVRRKSVEEIQ